MLGVLLFHYIEVLVVYLFFKQKTAYEMRISDWSSDVCSSDLLAFLDPSLLYDANDVTLRLTRNSISFAGIGQTPNQIAAGAGTESLGLGDPVADAVVTLSAAQARDAFDQLSGEIHASTRRALIEDSRFVRQAIWDR